MGLEWKARKYMIDLSEGDRTKQQFKDETDINKILARYEKTGQLTHISTVMPQYGDFTMVTDYQTAVHQVQEAQDAFMSIPAKIRSQFDNDPHKLIEFLDDPNNDQAAIDLGLKEGVKTPDPVDPPAVVDPPEENPPITGGE